MKTFPSRREFLKRAALLASTTALAFPTMDVEAAMVPISRTGGPFLRPSLNAFSFLELLNANMKDASKGIDLFGICDYCAKHDIEAVDLTGYFFPGYPKAPADAYVNRIKRHAHGLGIDISGTGVRNDFATADKAVRAAGVGLAKNWIEVAARLGAPVVRVFAGPQPPHKDWQSASGNATRDEVEAWMADSVRECAEHGAKFGVIVAVQNHGDFISSGPQHLSLLNRVDHPWCGPLVDTGMYLTEDPYADIAMMAPHAVNWQIKETLGSTMASPAADFGKLAKLIHASGYRGYLPIETLSMKRKDYDPAAEVAKVLRVLREEIRKLQRA